MPYHFIFTTKAEVGLKQLESVDRKRILKKISKLSEYDNINHVAKMLTADLSSFSRIRIRQYRLVCEIEGGVVTMLWVQHRKNVYI